MDAANIYTAILAGRFDMPAYTTEGGRRIKARTYDLSDVGSRISEDQRRLIEWTALRDQCEAGRMIAEALRVEAMELAVELESRLKEAV